MRVGDRSGPGAPVNQAGKSAEPARVAGQQRQGGTSRAGSAGDRVEISTTAGRIAEAMEASGSERAERVQALTVEYEAGRYQPDPLKISRAMVAEAFKNASIE